MSGFVELRRGLILAAAATVSMAVAAMQIPQTAGQEGTREAATPSVVTASGPLRSDWVEKDQAIAKMVQTGWPTEAIRIDDLRKALGKARPAGEQAPDGRDLDFGGRLVSFEIHGGYCTCWVRAFVVGGQVLEARAHLRPSTEVWQREKPEILKVCGRGATPLDDGIEWKYLRPHEDPAWARYEKVRNEALGGIVTLRCGTGEPLSEYAMLMSPLSELRFGTMCGDGGDPPPGRAEIEAVAKRGSDILLRNVLRSPNPEARVYAAEALLKRRAGQQGLFAQAGDGAPDPLNPAEQKAIAAIRTSKLLIQTCSGCELLTQTAAEILAH